MLQQPKERTDECNTLRPAEDVRREAAETLLLVDAILWPYESAQH